MRNMVTCCKAQTGICERTECHHWDDHKRVKIWKSSVGHDKYCTQWKQCVFIKNAKVRCFKS